MYVYLVRHGEAKSEEEDPSRGLTGKGMDDAWNVAEFISRKGVHVSRILHSGKTRAMQTAEMMADFLSPDQDAAETDGLGPTDDPAKWAARLGDITDDTMLVGHLPFMARLAGLLLCGDKEKMFVDFAAGGIICLKRLDSGQWTLVWMIGPDLARQH